MATQGIWIPVEIMKDANLTQTEKFLLAEIAQLSTLENGCYASNNHFANLIGITRNNASRCLTTLANKGYIVCSIKMGTRNRERSIKMIRPYPQNDETVVSKRQETKENKHINKHINKQVAPSPMYVPIEGLSIANHLLSKIRTAKPNFKQPNIKEWAKDMDKAMRIDLRTKEQLIGCIDWIYAEGSFWIPNILSCKKLREKFDTMEMQMMAKGKNNNGLDAMLEAYNAS